MVPLAVIVVGTVFRSTTWVNGLVAELLDRDSINFDPKPTEPNMTMTIADTPNPIDFQFNQGSFDSD
jgi:hypothetical protein